METNWMLPFEKMTAVFVSCICIVCYNSILMKAMPFRHARSWSGCGKSMGFVCTVPHFRKMSRFSARQVWK